ncbi:Spy/CpxP family protein refolding chaperone [Merismopedia glauca]|uniref:Spy protein n=1 Tax=Merismopedia glauca CCAP 1448/3 TaxID=1296344 RepID=A0A2T1C488_9CYAN|nr:Spy/CpxP family protein refolding chaperone [Merismopedia glauca]PSB03095.1 Spy protein [Merismopedia glauca CCAP 1448/3]
MKFNKLYLLGLFLIPAFSAGSLSFPALTEAQPMIAGRMGHKEQEIFKALNLSPSQVTRMQAIRQNYKNRIAQREQSLKQAHKQFQNLMASNASAGQIRAKHNQVQDLQNQIGDLRLESLLEMREVLTPSQRQKLAQIMAKKRSIRPHR